MCRIWNGIRDHRGTLALVPVIVVVAYKVDQSSMIMQGKCDVHVLRHCCLSHSGMRSCSKHGSGIFAIHASQCAHSTLCQDPCKCSRLMRCHNPSRCRRQEALRLGFDLSRRIPGWPSGSASLTCWLVAGLLPGRARWPPRKVVFLRLCSGLPCRG